MFTIALGVWTLSIAGTYEDHLGTKLFFIEEETNKLDNAFAKATPIHLKYLCKCAKILKLKWQKVTSCASNVTKEDHLNIHFNESYNEVLKKLEKGQLNLQDITSEKSLDPSKNNIHTSKSELEVREKSAPTQSNIKIETETLNTPKIKSKIPCSAEDNTDGRDTCQTNYQILKDLMQTPLPKPEDLKMPEADYVSSEISNLNNFVKLQELFLSNLSLADFPKEFETNDFNLYVDVRQSIEDGIISSTDANNLTLQQKEALLSCKNFDNFSVPMKLTFLIEQLKKQKYLLSTMCESELSQVDEYGRNAKDRYKLLKYLTKNMWYYVYSDVNYNLQNMKRWSCFVY